MFPQVADAATTVQTNNSTAWVMNIPAHSAGDLLLALIGTDGAPTAAAAALNGVAWTEFVTIANSTNNKMGAAWLRATVDQPTPTTVVVTMSATEQGVIRCLRITGAHATQAPAAGVALSGSSTLPNPPSLTAPWGVDDTLWIAMSNTDAAVSATVYPTNMDVATGFSDVSGSANGAGLHTCRAERAVATLDPGTFTLSATETWTAQTIAIRPAIYVPQTRYGAVSMPVTFGKAVAGRRTTFGQLDRSFIFAASVAGDRVAPTYYGSLAMPLAFDANVAGSRKTFGQLQSPFIFGKAVAGQRKTFGQVAMPLSMSIAVSGFRAGLTLYGAVSLPVIFGKDVRGQRKAFGQLALPIAFGKDVRGQRKTFGQVVFPIIFTKEAIGRKNVFGQLSMQTLFGKETAGQRRTFSQLAMPITFSKAVAGRRQTFGQVALPINFLAFVNGQSFVGPKTYYGQLAMPIAFNKQVNAYRKTFGVVNAPFIFGAASQGRRKTFSQLVMPINFQAMVTSGRVGTYGQISLPIIVDFETDGKTFRAGVVLNSAIAIFLGTESVRAVYVGEEFVWPIFNPLKIPGLVTWLDSEEYVSGFWPNKGIGPAITIAGAPAPTLTTLNGLPVVRFAANQGRIRSAWPYAVNEFTLIYLIRWVGPQTGRAFSVQYPPSNLLVGMHTSQPDTAYDNGTWLTKGTSWANWGAGPSPWRMYGADSQLGQGMGFYVDGVPIGGRSGDSAGLTGGWGISGYETTGPGETVDIEMPEFLLFNRKLPDAERQLLEAYLREKWGV